MAWSWRPEISLTQAVCALFFFAPVLAQGGRDDARAFEGAWKGGVGLSATFVDVDGSGGKYRTDWNYRPGLELSDFVLEFQPEDSRGGWLDFLSLRAAGFGDVSPYQQAELSLGKRSRFRFKARFRQQDYFFNLPTFALGGHAADSTRKLLDLSLRLYPASDLTLEVSYSQNRQLGTDFSSEVVLQNLFELRDPGRSFSRDFRLGLFWRRSRVKISLLQNFRKYKEDPERREHRLLEEGVLPRLEGGAPVRLSVPSTQLLVDLEPSPRWNVTTQYAFGRGRAEASRLERLFLDLRQGVSLEQILRDTSFSRRPEHRLGLRAQLQLAEGWLLVNEVRLHQFHIDGSLTADTTFRSPMAGTGELTGRAEQETAFGYLVLEARPHLELRLHERLTLSAGYHYFDRLVERGEEMDREVTVSHGGFAGASWWPHERLRLRGELERARANQAFTVTEARHRTRVHLSGEVTIAKELRLYPYLNLEDRSNPALGQSFDSLLRQGGVGLHLAALGQRWSLSVGYHLLDLESRTDLQFFLGKGKSRGVSRYLAELHFLRGRLEGSLSRRLGLRLGCGWLKDPEGNSFPLSRWQGEVGLSVRLGLRWWWDLDWSHVSYNEAAAALQDYRANRLVLTSRWSF